MQLFFNFAFSIVCAVNSSIIYSDVSCVTNAFFLFRVSLHIAEFFFWYVILLKCYAIGTTWNKFEPASALSNRNRTSRDKIVTVPFDPISFELHIDLLRSTIQRGVIIQEIKNK